MALAIITNFGCDNMVGEKSLLVEFLGDYPFIRVVDFLLENKIFDYSKTEIAEKSGVGWTTLNLFWDKLEKFGLVKKTRKIGRATMYKLNEESPVVKKLMELDFKISSCFADKLMEEETKKEMSIKPQLHP